MTWEKFWSIIDRVRAQADMQDEASVKQFLYTELINLPQDELLGFDCAWQSYRNQANFPKMVAAACIINDGSSDDRFTDFRNWLIMQGYDAYRQALIDPDNLAALNIPFRDTEWMGCGNVAWYAYAGQKLHTYFEKEGIAAKLFRKYPALLKSSADLHQAIMQEQLVPHRAPETEWERQMLRTEVKHYIDTSGLAYSYNEFYNKKLESRRDNGPAIITVSHHVLGHRHGYLPQRRKELTDNRQLADEIVRLVHACCGHALVLFTSYRQMAEVKAMTDGRWPYPTFQAWRNGGRVIQQFKESGNGILFAAGSCWEGIDFPGNMVSLLIIAKLPFPIPDPVSDYERRQYPNLRDYINAEIIPEMQKKLRQGFGRAIRTEQDSCVVAILDERAGIGGKYHDAALAALPTCPTTEKIEDVQQFIREQKRPDYFL